MRFRFLVIAVCIVSLVAACGQDEVETAEVQSSEGEILVGVTGPMTGDNAVWGRSAFQAVEMAANEINEDGGVLGREVAIRRFDDKADPKEAASIAREAIGGDFVAMIGPIFSSTALAAGPIYTQGRLPSIVVLATNPEVVEKGGEYVFRLNINDTIVGEDMGAYVYEEMGIRRVGVLEDQTDYTVALVENFSRRFEELGGEMVGVQKYVGGQDRDFRVMLTSLEEQNPDAIFISGYPNEAALITQQAKQEGIDATIFTGDIATPDYLDLAGNAAEGVNFFTSFDRSIDDPAVQELVKKYEETYDEGIWTTVPWSYDAMYYLAAAIEEAGSTDREAVRDALASLEGFVGATGPIELENRDNPRGWLVRLVVQDGEYKTLDVTVEGV